MAAWKSTICYELAGQRPSLTVIWEAAARHNCFHRPYAIMRGEGEPMARPRLNADVEPPRTPPRKAQGRALPEQGSEDPGLPADVRKPHPLAGIAGTHSGPAWEEIRADVEADAFFSRRKEA